MGVKMINNLIKCVFIPLLFSVFLFGCGGSGSDSPSQILVLGEGYDEKAGDSFTTSLSMSATYSNGQTAQINSVSVSTYSEVDEIPAKYNYSNAISGPYLLETTNKDGILDELGYMTLSGEGIIEDELDYFTNVEYTTESGSDEPENIYIGDKFNFYQNATLFNSQTGVEAGYRIVNMAFTVLSEEIITVPAGEFNAAKIGYSISETLSENNIIDTLSATGYGWFDTTNGYMLKMTADGDMTLNEQALTASFTSEIILQSYFISPSVASNTAARIMPVNTLSNTEIKAGLIFFSLKKGFSNFH
jgi:hypothetical protein